MRFQLTWVLLASLAAGCGTQRPGVAEPATGQGAAGAIVCYVGPNMRVPMEELARLHEQRTGSPVSVEADEVRKLIARLEGSHRADIFVTHDPFLTILMDRGIEITDAWTVASVQPVIAVLKGNPKKITAIEGLGRPGLRIGLTDADNAISGQIATVMLKKAGVAEQVEPNLVMRTMTGRAIASALLAGEIDACIVWNVVVFGHRDKLEAVEIAPRWWPKIGVDAIADSPALGRLELDYVRVGIATLGRSVRPDAARAFARFVTSPEGRAVFARNGFTPADPSRPTLPKW